MASGVLEANQLSGTVMDGWVEVYEMHDARRNVPEGLGQYQNINNAASSGVILAIPDNDKSYGG